MRRTNTSKLRRTRRMQRKFIVKMINYVDDFDGGANQLLDDILEGSYSFVDSDVIQIEDENGNILASTT